MKEPQIQPDVDLRDLLKSQGIDMVCPKINTKCEQVSGDYLWLAMPILIAGGGYYLYNNASALSF